VKAIPRKYPRDKGKEAVFVFFHLEFIYNRIHAFSFHFVSI